MARISHLLKNRRGSILVLVVVLLVLMALIGTAYLSTTRIDRYSTQQQAANTQGSVSLDAATSVVEAAIDQALYGTSPANATLYRMPSILQPPGPPYSPYLNYTSYRTDLFLASRIPQDTVSGQAGPLWNPISWPLTANGPGGATPYQMDRPDNVAPYVFPAAPTKDQYLFVPTSTTIGTLTVPAFNVYQIGNSAPVAPNVPAVDTDGDGIADAMYFKLPMAPVDGVTYYAAARIIDNNSAVNVNTAFYRDNDFNATGAAAAVAPYTTNDGMFRSNVGLADLLTTYTAASMANATEFTTLPSEAQNLALYRLNSALGAAPGVAGSSTTAITNDAGTASRNDFQFLSLGDALEMQLARRLDNPGANNAGSGGAPSNFRLFSIADGLSLASDFCVRNSQLSQTTLESTLPTSLYTSAATTPYSATTVATWYSDNFFDAANDTPARAVRAYLTTRNPVSNLIPVQSTTAPPAAYAVPTPASGVQPASAIQSAYATAYGASPPSYVPVPYSATPCKTSINTALFPELWRAFFSVMVDNPTSAANPNYPYVPSYLQSLTTAPNTQYAMFRNSLRDPHATPYTFAPSTELLLRSALAAVNAETLRTSGTAAGTAVNDVFCHDITLPTLTGANSSVTVRVYGMRPQPLITQIFASTDNETDPGSVYNPTSQATPPVATPGLGQNVNGYMAIELYNPTEATINVTNYVLAWLDRTPGGTMSLPNGNLISNFSSFSPPLTSIPKHTYVILENYNGSGVGGTDAKWRPAASGLQPQTGTLTTSPTAIDYYVPNLAQAFNHELVLLRPRVLNTPEPNLVDNVPLDSYDFTGLSTRPQMNALGQTKLVTAWHYLRANDSTKPASAWRCVYPSFYNPALGTITEPRQTGVPAGTATQFDQWTVYYYGNYGSQPNPDDKTPAVDTEGWITKPPLTGTITMGQASAVASYSPTFAIQLSNTNWAGPPSTYPFGGFARNGDILQVPFIGAYRVAVVDATGSVTTLVELNPITLDSAAADACAEQVSTLGADEQVGRFCPLAAVNPTNPSYTAVPTAGTEGDYYAWASRLFDYLTVQNPNDDYLPNAPNANPCTPVGPYYTPPPYAYDSTNGVANNPTYLSYSPATWPVANVNPTIINSITAATTGTEDAVPVHGLININTADWKVLSMLPLVLNSSGQVNRLLNPAMAQAIVAYRVAHGPFKTIFDLNQVSASGNPTAFQIPTGFADDQGHGEFGGFAPPAGYKDFKYDFLQITRLSNLITTRSDSFTCYVVVQGWRNAGTANATLASQRRLAFILDRSAVTQTNPNPTRTNIPTN